MPIRDTFWNIPQWTKLLLYITNYLAIVILVSKLYLRGQLWFQGKGKLSFDRLPRRVVRVFRYAIVQTRITRNKYAGIFHLSIFFAFVMLFIGTILVAIDDYGRQFFEGFTLLQGSFYLGFETILDFFTIVGISGLTLALLRRNILRPDRLTYSTGFQAMLWILLIDLLSGLAIETFRLAAVQPDWQVWSFAGYTLSRVLGLFNPTLEFLKTAHVAAWIVHFSITALIYVLFLDLPFKHIIYSPLNIFFAPFKHRGALTVLDLEDDSIETFGVGALSDLTIQQLIDGDACTECGLCQQTCPAHMAGTPLNPKQIILNIRDGLDFSAASTTQESGLSADYPLLQPDALWACTTCYACVYECPVLIQHVDSIVDMRRNLVLMEGDMPDLLGMAMTQAERSGNPWGNPKSDRMKWAEGLEVPLMSQKRSADVLYWIGCAGAYDPESQKTARSVVKILQAASIDFAVLGEEERCNCEWARRGGNEYLYQEATHSNIAVFDKYEFNTIITHCPHCFNTFKNEYPEFGGDYDVIHHSTYIAQLIYNGHLKIDKPLTEQITYHDSCYLGRYNNVYEEPRQTLQAVKGINVIEMDRNRGKGLCCGGGGAQVWFETPQEHPVNEIRLEEALQTGADSIGTACPFCTIMLGSAAQSTGQEIKVQDISVIIAGALD